jgi:hypothetical protein
MSDMLTGNWAEFVKGVSARVDEIIDETKDLIPSFMSAGLHKKVQADGLIHRTEGVTGFAYLELTPEGDSFKEDRTYPAYKTEYVVKQTGKQVSISQLLMKTRPAELEAKLDEIRQLRIAATRTLNKWAWQPLVDGFVTTDSSANFPTARLSDAVALYSASHPSLVAGVSNRSNRVSANPVLSETALFTAIKMIREQKNGRGLPIGFEGRFVLVVPPALEKTAFEITKSVLKSGSANHDINYFSGGTVDVLSSVYLGTANGGNDLSWYVFAKDDYLNSLRYVSLIEPKIERDIDFNTKSIKVSIDGACAFGYSNFELTAASSGAGS